jgi:hypothetical protein
VLALSVTLLGACQATPEYVVVTPIPAMTPHPTEPPIALDSPTVGPLTSATVAPSPNPTAPVTTPIRTPLRTLAEAVFSEQTTTSWPSDPDSTAWLEEGVYRLFAREPDRFIALGSPLGTAGSDVVVSALFRKVGGPPGGGYGLIVRDQEPGQRDGLNQGGRYYVLEAGDQGEVGIWRREVDQWVHLVPWAPSELVRRGGQTNQLTVQAIGTRLTLLVNGLEAASVEDTVLSTGGVGVFVGGDFNQVELEWFVARAP